MKAAIVTKYGSVADVALQEVDVPKFGPADVLVRVEAASVTPLDVKLISGQMQGFFPFATPYIAGTDFSGLITEVGRRPHIGRRVIECSDALNPLRATDPSLAGPGP